MKLTWKKRYDQKRKQEYKELRLNLFDLFCEIILITHEFYKTLDFYITANLSPVTFIKQYSNFPFFIIK